MLKGITVIEFGRIFSAPLAGKILADLGAKVIKIERKKIGDESRHYGMMIDDNTSDYFFALNSIKETIELDLKNPLDLTICLRMLKDADVLIHNSLQNSFDKLGLSYDVVSQLNPKLIYTSISGYGNLSKFQNDPSQDMTIQGLSGFMSLNGYKNEMPIKTGVPVIDYVTGQSAVIGILTALWERNQTGKGKHVSLSLLESALSVISIEATRYLNLGHIATRNGNRHYSIAPYGSYQVKDGYINIAIANDEMFKRFAKLINLDDQAFSTNQIRLEQIDKLDALINQKIKDYTVSDIITLLKDNKISCGPINDIAKAFDSPEIKELKMIKEKDNKKYLKTPINFS